MPRVPANPVPAGAVGLRLELAAADRDRLRIAAAMNGRSMAAMAREIIVAYLDEIDQREPATKPKGKVR